MYLTWYRLRCCLSSALLVAAGCATTLPDLKPPKRREALVIPPDAEARFDKPVAFPENTLNQAPGKGKVAIADASGDGGTPSRFSMAGPAGMGAGPGMGGMGMGGGGMGGGMGGMGGQGMGGMGT